MSYFWKNVRELPKTLLVEVLKAIILLVLTAAFTSLTTSLKDQFPWIANYIWFAYIIAACLVALILIKLYQKFNKLNPDIPSIDPNFYIIEKEIYHAYTTIDSVIHRRRFKLRALKGGLRSFHDQFIWTGDGYDLSCKTNRFKLIETGKSGYYDTYEIRFDRALQKGDEVEFLVEWNCTNNNLKAVPFFSTTVQRPMDKLILSLELSPSLSVHEASLETSYSKGATPDSYTRKQLDNGNGQWVIDNPKLLYHYEVKWNFN